MRVSVGHISEKKKYNAGILELIISSRLDCRNAFYIKSFHDTYSHCLEVSKDTTEKALTTLQNTHFCI